MSQPDESTKNPVGSALPGFKATLNLPSLAALILGILAIVTLGCFLIGIPAIILAIIGMRGVANSNGAQKGKGFALSGLILGLVSLILQTGIFMWVAKQEDASPISFRKAEKKIGGPDIGLNGFGNNDEAIRLAESFSTKMDLMRAVMFAENNGGSTAPLADRGFMTYCLLNDDSCVFMIHVPNLRKYEEKARDSIADMAWRAANGILAKHQFREGNKMAVGTKGVINYHRIDVGTFVSDMDSTKNRGIETSGYTSSLLESFFPKPSFKTLIKTKAPRP